VRQSNPLSKSEEAFYYSLPQWARNAITKVISTENTK
jgi:hypothetical protein